MDNKFENKTRETKVEIILESWTVNMLLPLIKIELKNVTIIAVIMKNVKSVVNNKVDWGPLKNMDGINLDSKNFESKILESKNLYNKSTDNTKLDHKNLVFLKP